MTRVIGIDPIPVPDELLLDYTLSSKKLTPRSIRPSCGGWIDNGVYIEDSVERSKMLKSLNTITRLTNKKALLKGAVFCITEFTDRNNWKAVRVRSLTSTTDVYAPWVEGLAGHCVITMKNGDCSLTYYSVNCITEKLVG